MQYQKKVASELNATEVSRNSEKNTCNSCYKIWVYNLIGSLLVCTETETTCFICYVHSIRVLYILIYKCSTCRCSKLDFL